jgi:hypothetical protein
MLLFVGCCPSWHACCCCNAAARARCVSVPAGLVWAERARTLPLPLLPTVEARDSSDDEEEGKEEGVGGAVSSVDR